MVLMKFLPFKMLGLSEFYCFAFWVTVICKRQFFYIVGKGNGIGKMLMFSFISNNCCLRKEWSHFEEGEVFILFCWKKEGKVCKGVCLPFLYEEVISF